MLPAKARTAHKRSVHFADLILSATKRTPVSKEIAQALRVPQPTANLLNRSAVIALNNVSTRAVVPTALNPTAHFAVLTLIALNPTFVSLKTAQRSDARLILVQMLQIISPAITPDSAKLLASLELVPAILQTVLRQTAHSAQHSQIAKQAQHALIKFVQALLAKQQRVQAATAFVLHLVPTLHVQDLIVLRLSAPPALRLLTLSLARNPRLALS